MRNVHNGQWIVVFPAIFCHFTSLAKYVSYTFFCDEMANATVWYTVYRVTRKRTKVHVHCVWWGQKKSLNNALYHLSFASHPHPPWNRSGVHCRDQVIDIRTLMIRMPKHKDIRVRLIWSCHVRTLSPLRVLTDLNGFQRSILRIRTVIVSTNRHVTRRALSRGKGRGRNRDFYALGAIHRWVRNWKKIIFRLKLQQSMLCIVFTKTSMSFMTIERIVANNIY